MLIIENSLQNKIAIEKITALWAFSEAALGGILHLFKIPFTGLFIGSSAVIFISLISYYSNSRYTIFEAALKVILVKFIVSPYTPINAYFAVLLQTILGFFLFWGGFNKVSAIVLGFLSLLFSGIQKIIIITLVFGMTFWESIDVFIEFIFNRIFPNYDTEDELIFSFVIVATYLILHIVGGILAGFYASKLPSRIMEIKLEPPILMQKNFNGRLNSGHNKKKKPRWWLKPSSIIIVIFSLILIAISFLFEDVDKTFATDVIIMLFRSVIIIIVWYYFLSPLLLSLLNKFLATKKKKHLEELNRIVDVFPNIRNVVKYSWSLSRNTKGIRKPFFLMDNVLITYLLYEYKIEEEN